MKYSLWLQQVLGYGFPRTAAVFERFGSSFGVYSADSSVLAKCGLFSVEALKRAKNKSLKKAENVIALCEKYGIKTVVYGDKNYPDCLLNIPDSPIVLFYNGILPDFDRVPSVCIVGPRRCSDYGIKASYSLSSRLSRGGMIIVSGGAVGVDAAAHEGALSEKGVTVAVMPCGFGHDYLRENQAMRENIIRSGGCIITEYPPEFPVKRGTFQVRNRLMSALSLGTVVVEAGERSGALITARHALEQGKDIFVIPGKPGEPQYIGSNKLLQDGAKPLLSARDVFYEYCGVFNDKLDIDKAYSGPLKPYNKTATQDKIKHNTAAPPKTLGDLGVSRVAKSIYDAAPDTAFCLDELAVFNDFDAAELMSAMTELELCGYIKAVPGGRYLRIK